MKNKITSAGWLKLHLMLKYRKISFAGLLISLFVFSSLAAVKTAEPKNEETNLFKKGNLYSLLMSEDVFAPTNLLLFGNQFPAFLLNHASLQADKFPEKTSHSLPPCELDYLPPAPISFGVQGGTGNFPIFNKDGQGPCPNPSVTTEEGSPGVVTNVGAAYTTSYTYQIFFRVAPNLTGEPRLINFNIYTDGVLTGNAQILQSDGCVYRLGLETGTTMFSSAGGQEELDFDVSPDCQAVNITTDVSWMRVVGTTLIVDPAASPLADDADAQNDFAVASATGKRSGTVTIQGNGSAPTTLRISEVYLRRPIINPAKDKRKFLIRTKVASLGVRG